MIPNLLLATFALGLVAATVGAGTLLTLKIAFVCFLIFEFCVGLYWPTIATLKSRVVPEHVRATIYNLYRVPLNAVVCGLLLNNMSLPMSFTFCAVLLSIAILAMISILKGIAAETQPELK